MPTPNRNNGLGRRKACDFCCQKKTKCDAKKPKCSTCEMHSRPCLWTPGFAVSAKGGGVEKQYTRADIRRFEAIEDRLLAVESLLSQCQETRKGQTTPESWDRASEGDAYAPAYNTPPSPEALFPPHQAEDENESEVFVLPPEWETRDLARRYFQTFNQTLPLFHHNAFMAMLNAWYESPPRRRRDEASWAAINVMMALSIRYAPSWGSSSSSTRGSNATASVCMSNAQSVMDRMVYREQDLKGLQVVLGLVVLFLGSPLPYPSTVLIATAVQLVHRLRLHLRSGGDGDNVGGDTAAGLEERNRLFWVTYILDRDISSLTLEPYLLQDHDTDVDVDFAASTSDSYGPAVGLDSGSPFDHFHARIKLARVQGKIYDLVHSVRASKFNTTQKQAAVEKLNQLLDEWQASLPKRFSLESRSELNKSDQILSTILQISYSQCLFMVHKTHARDAGWISRLTGYSDSLMARGKEGGEAARSVTATGLRDSDQPLLPPNWSKLVETARTYLSLRKDIGEYDSALVWRTTCSHQAATLILAANNLTASEHCFHEQIDADAERVREGVAELGARLCEFEDQRLRQLWGVCADLAERAAEAVRRFREEGGGVDLFAGEG